MNLAMGVEIRESVTFFNEGKKIFGVLHLPITEKKHPAIAIFHGFASHKVGRNRAYVKIAEELAHRGIAVLRFDFRGSGDSEGSLSDMTISSLISDGIEAINFLKNQESIDPSHIGILGSSLGGAIAVHVAAQLQLQVLVLWAAVASGDLWYQDWIKRNPLKNSQDKEVLSTYNGIALNPEFRKQFAELHADKETQKLADLSFLHIQGDQDEVVSSMHRDAFQINRSHSRADSQFITVPDTNHALGFSPHFSLIQEETIQWFTKYLKNS